MHGEKTMYQLFMNIANADDRILAVYMNGSRTNANVPKDIFQDMTNFVVRKQLEKMLSWKVGILTDFGVSVGKSAAEFLRHVHDLPKDAAEVC